MSSWFYFIFSFIDEETENKKSIVNLKFYINFIVNSVVFYLLQKYPWHKTSK